MKSILSIILCVFLELSALFGGSGKISGGTTDPDIGLYDENEIVDVIVELDRDGLLYSIHNSVQREKLLENFFDSESYEKIQSAQKAVKSLIEEKFAEADLKNSYTYSFIANGFSLKIPYKYVDDLERLSGVKRVHISAAFESDESIEPNDGDEANLTKAGEFTSVPQVQQLGYTGKGVVVAILDTGFELSHEAFNFEVENPALSKKDINLLTTFRALNTIVPRWGANYYSQKIPYKWDYAEIDKTVENDNSGHGTHVAGIIGGKSDIITGVAPDAQFLCMKVFGDEEGSLASEHVLLAALDDAVKLGADVVNMSLGSPSGQEPDDIFINDVYKRLEKAGIAVICSAGNEASMGRNDAVPGSQKLNADMFDYGTVGSSASYSWCMAVASSAVNSKTSVYPEAINVSGVGSADMSSFSSWGVTADLRLKPEITAPGSNILSSVPGNTYDHYSGTSMASPYFAGAFALIRQYLGEKNFNLNDRGSAELINSILMSTATPFRGHSQPAYFSPRRQGAGLVNLEAAVSTKAYLTTESNKRPILSLGEDDDGTLEMSFVLHNMSSEKLTYDISIAPLTDSYKLTDGKYINTLTAKKIRPAKYSVEYISGVTDGKVTVEPDSAATVKLKISFDSELLEEQKTAFQNGFFLDGFVFLRSENEPELSIPYSAFCGDWETPMLFDRSMYDSEPSYLGRQWGLMVTDGEDYYPLGANIFEDEEEYGIDPRYCAYSENALKSKLDKPYVSVCVGLLRNAKRMDFNLFNQQGIFRYCGSTLLEYCRKTNDPNKANVGKLWGGGGLIDGNGYVYKVSTTPQNFPGGRTTVEFPFVVDNKPAKIESCSYEKIGEDNILKIKISDNRYVMGFEIQDESGEFITKKSFKGIEPVDGCYECEINMAEFAEGVFEEGRLDNLKLYILDYAYNETIGSISLSDNSAKACEDVVSDSPVSYKFNNASVVTLKYQEEQEAYYTGPFEKIINSLLRALNK